MDKTWINSLYKGINRIIMDYINLQSLLYDFDTMEPRLQKDYKGILDDDNLLINAPTIKTTESKNIDCTPVTYEINSNSNKILNSFILSSESNGTNIAIEKITITVNDIVKCIINNVSITANMTRYGLTKKITQTSSTTNLIEMPLPCDLLLHNKGLVLSKGDNVVFTVIPRKIVPPFLNCVRNLRLMYDEYDFSYRINALIKFNYIDNSEMFGYVTYGNTTSLYHCSDDDSYALLIKMPHNAKLKQINIYTTGQNFEVQNNVPFQYITDETYIVNSNTKGTKHIYLHHTESAHIANIFITEIMNKKFDYNSSNTNTTTKS